MFIITLYLIIKRKEHKTQSMFMVKISYAFHVRENEIVKRSRVDVKKINYKAICIL